MPKQSLTGKLGKDLYANTQQLLLLKSLYLIHRFTLAEHGNLTVQNDRDRFMETPYTSQTPSGFQKRASSFVASRLLFHLLGRYAVPSRFPHISTITIIPNFALPDVTISTTGFSTSLRLNLTALPITQASTTVSDCLAM